MATVREVTLQLLRELGMTTIFGNPGSTEMPFLRDFPDDFRYVLALQEVSALGMADGYAKGTGNAAFVNLHTAPGLGHAMGAIVTAYQNKTPLVITAGQQHRSHIALEPLLTGRLVDMAKPYVKRSYEPARAEDVPGEIARAYHTAMQQPRGPVFLSIPMDDWEAEAEPCPVHEVTYRTAPDPDSLESAARILAAAKKPAIVAGGGVPRTGSFREVVDLAERLRAPVWQAGGAPLAGFPQRRHLFQGVLPLAQRKVSDILAPHDAILVLGAPVFLYYPYLPGPIVKDGTQLIQITDDPDEAARCPLGMSILGDVGLAARALAGLLPESDRAMPPAPEPPPVPQPSTPISVEYVMHSLAELLPSNAVVADECGSSKGKLRTYIRTEDPLGYHSPASGGLGFAMPAAIGLKLALPARKVVCVNGDGSSMYAIQCLWTAAQHDVDITFVVINNGGYSILKAFSKLMNMGTVPGLDVPGVDRVLLARGLGVQAESATTPEQLRPALDRALRARGPYLVDVHVDPTVPSLLG